MDATTHSLLLRATGCSHPGLRPTWRWRSRLLARGEQNAVLAFEDRTGRQTDFDLRGTDEEIVARFSSQVTATEETRRGRPKLGVVAREITLLPRHWEWLAEQPGGASVTLRKLVDGARQSGDMRGGIRRRGEATDRFMSAMLATSRATKRRPACSMPATAAAFSN